MSKGQAMRIPAWGAGAHNLWRGEQEAREKARHFLVTNRGYEIPERDIDLLIEVVYPSIANGVLSKAMTVMKDLGDRRFTREALEALDLMRRRWCGLSARSRP